MNDLLLQLYSQYWDGMIQNIYLQHESAYPFLIQATPHYQTARKRIMFCGQETNGWGGEYPIPDATKPNDLMNIYNIVVNRNNNGEPIKRPGYYIRTNKLINSPYWNFQWRIMSQNPDVGYVVQNIVKIGKRVGAGCNDTIYQLTKAFFPVWKRELKILNPNCIIFLTGPYDRRIREIVGDFTLEPIKNVNGLLDRLVFEDSLMPVAYRTNHPRFLQSNHQYVDMATVISDIITNL